MAFLAAAVLTAGARLIPALIALATVVAVVACLAGVTQVSAGQVRKVQIRFADLS
jgi:hypothetical protein